jgi:hypothetical protein
VPAKSVRKRSFVKGARPPSGGALLGYARVSRGDEQNNSLQIKALKNGGLRCRRLFEEAASGGPAVGQAAWTPGCTPVGPYDDPYGARCAGAVAGPWTACRSSTALPRAAPGCPRPAADCRALASPAFGRTSSLHRYRAPCELHRKPVHCLRGLSAKRLARLRRVSCRRPRRIATFRVRFQSDSNPYAIASSR